MMPISRRMTFPVLLTLALGACAVLAGTAVSPAAPGKMPKKPVAKVMFTAAQIAHGKALSEEKGCNSCHGATYAGKPGFSPSIRANGHTKTYNAKTFARMLDTGVTDDGGMVRKPMPVYHLPTKDGTDVYAFLTTLK